jgi:hypothetical protein
MAADKAPSPDDAFEQAMACLRSGAVDSLERGAELLERAAALGSGQAQAKLAHFRALGVGGQADWNASLDLLEKAASMGALQAAEELKILARRPGSSLPELRRSIDIQAFIAPRETRIVSSSPRIRTVPGFMTPEECAWLVETSRPRLAPAEIYDKQRQGTYAGRERTNDCAYFALLDIDVVLVLLHARIANTIGLPSQCFEPTSVLHYAPGQEFLTHVDYLDRSQPGHVEELTLRGQRVATFLASLNQDYEAGETDFPRLSYRYKGGTGDALVFANVGPDLEPDPRTLHAGRPPSSGEKWLLSQWIRDRPAI